MDNQIKKTLTVLALFVALPSSSMAAPLWSDVATKQSTTTLNAKQLNPHANSRRVSVDLVQLRSVLTSATPSATALAQKSATTQLELPMPDGSQQIFNIVESSIMEPELAAKFPQIKTYKAVAANDATVSGRLDLGPNGFHGYLFTAKGEVFIDPIPSSAQLEYYSFYKRDYASIQPKKFSCGVKSNSPTQSPVAEFKNAELLTAAKTTGDIITYRLAVATTGEYSMAVAGGDAIGTMAEVTTAITRINEIYERDLGIRFLLIGNNDEIIFTNGATDPYSNLNGSAMLTENQVTLDNPAILTGGSGAYDLGHVFSTGGGGVAYLARACDISYKAGGVTGLGTPTGDPFYIDFVAHEIGHQLGANHSFNGTSGNCGTRNAATAFEPGGGSTIMAYAGICLTEDIAAASDATFHAGSIVEILAHTRTGSGSDCAVADVGSVAPIVAAGLDYNIPGGTAFTLNGSATDDEALVYQWDQMDAGLATTSATHGTDNGSNALFRSFLPVATGGERTFPQMSTILSNTPDKAETLPTESRTLNFRLTARDGLGGVDEDDMQVIVDGSKGPFEVLQPSTSIVLNPGSPQVIEWNTACTETAPVSCANVDILYSSDGGASFATVVGGTPNDGVESVFIPAGDTSTARIKVACTDNIFFDVSDVDFQINVAGTSLVATGTPPSCGTSGGGGGGGGGGGDDIEPNNTPDTAQPYVFPATLSGTVNSSTDIVDSFVFVANASAYTFTLSNFAGNDLDLYLYDSTVTIIGTSAGVGPSETIVKNLVAGQSYYVVVEAWATAGLDVPYTLTVTEAPISSGGGGGGTISPYWLFMLLMTPLFRLREKD